MGTNRADLRALCADITHRWALRMLSVLLLATLADGDLAYSNQKKRNALDSRKTEYCVEKVWPFWARGTKPKCIKEPYFLFSSPPFPLIALAYCAFFWNQWALLSIQKQRSRHAWKVLGLSMVPATGLAMVQFNFGANLDLWNVVAFVVPYIVFEGVIMSGIVVEALYVISRARSEKGAKERKYDIEAQDGEEKS